RKAEFRRKVQDALYAASEAARKTKRDQQEQQAIKQIQQENGLDYDSACILQKYRAAADSRFAPYMSEHDRLFAEKLEERLPLEPAEHAVGMTNGGNTSDNVIDGDGLDQRRRERDRNRGNGQALEYRAPIEQPTLPPPLPFISMANWDSEPVPQQQWSVLNR